jgi:hypothetical protein
MISTQDTKFTGEGKDAEGVRYMPDNQSLNPYRRVTFNQARSIGSGSTASHETGNYKVYHVLCPRTTDILLDLIKKPYLCKNLASLSSTSKYCVTASKMDKVDDQVKARRGQGENGNAKVTIKAG